MLILADVLERKTLSTQLTVFRVRQFALVSCSRFPFFLLFEAWVGPPGWPARRGGSDGGTAWHIAALLLIVVGKFGISKVSTSSKFCILQRAGGCTAQLCLCACFVVHHRFVTRKMSEKKALQYICRANLFILCGECQLGNDLFKIKEVSKTCRVYVLVIYGVDKEKFSKLFCLLLHAMKIQISPKPLKVGGREGLGLKNSH